MTRIVEGRVFFCCKEGTLNLTISSVCKFPNMRSLAEKVSFESESTSRSTRAAICDSLFIGVSYPDTLAQPYFP